MSNKTHIELDNRGRPLAKPPERFFSRHLNKVCSVFFFLLSISIGNYFYQTLSLSPLVKVSSYVTAFVLATLSSALAYLTAGVVFGQFEFCKIVFDLSTMPDYSITSSFVVLTCPVFVFIIRVLVRILKSPRVMAVIFLILLFASLALISVAVQFLINMTVFEAGPRIFSYSVVGIIYMTVFSLCSSPQERG